MQISVKIQFSIMIITILIIGCTTTSSTTISSSSSSSTQRSTVTSRPTATTRRTRHHRRSINATVQQLEAEFALNVGLVNSPEWKCGTPRPRLVYKNEAVGPASMNELNRSHIRWLSTATVLHRCESALGCCLYGICSPDTSQVVTKTFKAIDERTGEQFYPQLQFRNHTRCKCATDT